MNKISQKIDLERLKKEKIHLIKKYFMEDQKKTTMTKISKIHKISNIKSLPEWMMMTLRENNKNKQIKRKGKN
jgi:hypothetical protein